MTASKMVVFEEIKKTLRNGLQYKEFVRRLQNLVCDASANQLLESCVRDFLADSRP